MLSSGTNGLECKFVAYEDLIFARLRNGFNAEEHFLKSIKGEVKLMKKKTLVKGNQVHFFIIR